MAYEWKKRYNWKPLFQLNIAELEDLWQLPLTRLPDKKNSTINQRNKNIEKKNAKVIKFLC